MNSDNHKLDDLVRNESFISWVLDPYKNPNEYWDQYQKENLDNPKELEEAIELVKKLNNAKTVPTVNQKGKILENIHAEIYSLNTHPKQDLKWKRFVKIAAVFVLICSAYFIFISSNKTQFATHYNQIKNINLPDGSEVVLNANSSIKYNSNWDNTTDREIWLEGEAYFNVRKSNPNGKRKFLVHTSDLTVTVLGTQFNVNSHDVETKVVLEEGKIDVEIKRLKNTVKDNTLSMIPGQKTSFNQDAKKYQVSKVNTAVYTSWKDGNVVFDGTPLSELKMMIENNYGYQVKFDNEKLLTKKLDGKIDNPDLETLLSTLETIFNLKIQKKGKSIIIKE